MRHFLPARSLFSSAYQSGAALVVALVLLVALTLMALASMNSASLDLMMAGNEQFGSRAFSASEAGLSNAIMNGTFNSQADFSKSATSMGLGSDSYSYTITRPTGGSVGGAPSGFSLATGSAAFGTIPFRITSSGTSEHGARSTTIQEILYITPADSSGATCNASAGGCGLGD